jgi:hypothetical protein
MSEQYLWDGGGEVDPDVTKLEEALAGFRWSGKPLPLEPAVPDPWWREKKYWAIAAAALLVVGLGSSFFWLQTHRTGPATSWQFSREGQKPVAVRSGEWIETGPDSARIESESVGEVDIAPDSRLRVLASRADHHRLALDHGTIRAFIWAPPAKFVVDTPAAKTVDLGCKYKLSVEKDGTGFLQVELGWVAFEWNKVESFIPEGAACFTRVGHGPDTPYFLDAPRALTKSLIVFDATGDGKALETVLTEARPRDALTLWHLLERTQGIARSDVYARFAELVKLPPGVTRDGILRGDQKSMDAAWNALELGDTSWWREWKRNW